MERYEFNIGIYENSFNNEADNKIHKASESGRVIRLVAAFIIIVVVAMIVVVLISAFLNHASFGDFLLDKEPPRFGTVILMKLSIHPIPHMITSLY